MKMVSYPVYFRYPSQLASRISYGENHPERQAFYTKLENAKRDGFDLAHLDSVTQLVDDDVNPSKECPELSVCYLGLEDIQSNTGKATYEFLLGKDIRSNSKRLHRGNIVFSGLRPYLNKCHLIEVQESLGSSELFVMLPDEDKLIPGFLLRYLLSDMVLEQTKWILTGSSYPRLDVDDFKHLVVVLPKKEIQLSILNQLQPLEHEIEDKETESVKLTEQSQEIMVNEMGLSVSNKDIKSYFFKTGAESRALWFSVPALKLTDRLHYLFFHPRLQALKQIQNKFATVSLGEICSETIIRGEQPDYDENGTVLVLKTTNLKDAFIDFDNALKVSEKFFQDHPPAQVRKNDILVASTGYVSMGKIDIYDSAEPAIVDGHISIIRVKEGYDPLFIAYYLRSHFGKLQFERWFSGSSGQIELQPTDLGNFVLPDNSADGIPLAQQRHISKMVKEVLDESRKLRREAETMRYKVRTKFNALILGSAL